MLGLDGDGSASSSFVHSQEPCLERALSLQPLPPSQVQLSRPEGGSPRDFRSIAPHSSFELLRNEDSQVGGADPAQTSFTAGLTSLSGLSADDGGDDAGSPAPLEQQLVAAEVWRSRTPRIRFPPRCKRTDRLSKSHPPYGCLPTSLSDGLCQQHGDWH